MDADHWWEERNRSAEARDTSKYLHYNRRKGERYKVMAGHLLSIKICVDCISKPYIKFVTVQKQIGMNDITDRNKLNTYEETLKHCKIKASGIIQKLEYLEDALKFYRICLVPTVLKKFYFWLFV